MTKDTIKADAEKFFTSLILAGNVGEAGDLLTEGHFAGLIAAEDSIVKKYKVVFGNPNVLTVTFKDNEAYKVTYPKAATE